MNALNKRDTGGNFLQRISSIVPVIRLWKRIFIKTSHQMFHKLLTTAWQVYKIIEFVKEFMNWESTRLFWPINPVEWPWRTTRIRDSLPVNLILRFNFGRSHFWEISYWCRNIAARTNLKVRSWTLTIKSTNCTEGIKKISQTIGTFLKHFYCHIRNFERL